MKRSIGLLSFACMLAVGPALAAPGSGDWTGFSVGAAIGYNRNETDWGARKWGGPPALTTPAFLPAGAQPDKKYTSDGGHAGVFGGYDYQIGSRFVLGAVGDFYYDIGSKKSGYIPGTVWYTLTQQTSDTVEVTTNWDASVRLRAGILATPKSLFFASGGLGVTDREIKVTCPIDKASPRSWCITTPAGVNEKNSDLLYGWTVGGGWEGHVAAHWSLRAEYRFTDYGKDNHTFLSAGTNVDALNVDLNSHSHALNLGVAYRF